MKRATIVLLLPILLSILLPSLVLTAHAPSDNQTGLTAALVATSNQIISGSINATGFDMGIYVGPGVTGVVIKNAVVFGANDHGIFIEDTSGIVIMNSVITGNDASMHNGLPEDKAILLAGTSNSIVKNNNVSSNLGDGGISITDDGPFDPGAPNPGSPNPGNGNVIMGNLVKNNRDGCGIVVAAYNPGEGVSNNLIKDNTVIGNSPGPNSPFIGGIVVAADAPNTTSANNLVLNNTVRGGWIPGIIVHSNAPGDIVTGTLILRNSLSSNGAFRPSESNDAQKPTGINIVAEVAPGEPTPPVLTRTLVIGNSVTNDYYGVWHQNDTDTKIIHLQGNATVPIAP